MELFQIVWDQADIESWVRESGESFGSKWKPMT